MFEGVRLFSRPPYHTQIDPKFPPKQTVVSPVPEHLMAAFQQEFEKMLQVDYIKLVYKTIP